MSVPPSPDVTTSTSSAATDEAMLAELGYKQELHRGMSGFSNFAVSFSIISVLAGCITSYAIAMNAGGPIAISIGWPLVGAFVLLVALAMAEICSVYPTAGGLYFWAGRLARRNKRVWAWYVGWFNFLGEVAVTAAIDFGAAVTWMALLSLLTGIEVTAVSTFIAFLIIIGLHGLLNTFGVNLVKVLSNVSAWWHLVGVAIIVAVLALVPDQHQSLSWTFLHFENRTGWDAPFYAFLIGLLMAQYTYTGFDASAHVAEETINATTEAPKGLVRSVWVSILAGWVLLVAVTASIQDYDAALATDIGLPPAQIFIDAAGRSLGIFLLFIAAVAQFFCGMASVTANSRMSYAFSRDNALPGSRLWAQVNPRTGTPTNSIWLCVVCSIVLTTPALWSTTAYLAVTSIAVIGLYIAYVVPVFLRRTNPDFRPGRWNLGRWSGPIGWVSVVWVGFIVVLFMLPPASPITVNTFNYAPLAVLAVLVFSTVTWFIGGRVHFMRDVPQGHDTKPASEIFG
ncbi:amino acid permease [Humibacillus xanthopallidus]|uniref:Amino acid/polyamine/organocation transporter (APC superfamily) n=1 Tax=Humibacillus xanthopallidus TaxID=412689 RepID=A0A543HVW6_9MICO|nr:amino acid permease [Humibacillus xanthopallidus]TQM62483.1 amino acid/polyamine/organocation transporter (APC superfamily) [Humibacillus xanthopallidus]